MQLSASSPALPPSCPPYAFNPSGHSHPVPPTPRPCLWAAGKDPSEGPQRGDPKGSQGEARQQVSASWALPRSVEGGCATLLGRRVPFLLLVPLPRPPTRPGSGESSVGKAELWA